ncbi:unnamed protein product [Paramecium sonneborni]|uniref:RING-type domain-containing protein n=1 Tax=Paramecium sonneborni TaxID=65129 RepID=A0A8S1MC80_9CILI|nr:unnamed protein product [Paramecium sonneborni]
MQQEEAVEQMLEQGGIPISQLCNSRVNIDLLQCPICFNILWKPIACGQDRCFSSFCQFCIESWLNQKNAQSTLEEEEGTFANENNCPKCKRVFIKTEIPLVKVLLSQIELKCVHQDCIQVIPYEEYENHIINCKEKKKQCRGCQQYILQNKLEEHETECSQIPVECQKCHKIMPKIELEFKHDKYNCIDNLFKIQDQKLENLYNQYLICDDIINYYEEKIGRMINGDLIVLNEYNFFTIFNANYQFTNDNLYIARLVRNSYNYNKQKNDFLHFYVDYHFTTGLEGYEWRTRLIRLRGNLLIGVCSSQLSNSVDFIVNRLGEVKKKEENDNRYHIIRKVNFTFGEGDVIRFQILPFMQCLRITNETRHLTFCFNRNELQEMGDQYFSFFSLEYQGDALQFL